MSLTDFKYIIKNPKEVIEFWLRFCNLWSYNRDSILVVYLYCQKEKWNALEIFDFVVAVALGQGFGRIGCLLAGCCYGG